MGGVKKKKNGWERKNAKMNWKNRVKEVRENWKREKRHR